MKKLLFLLIGVCLYTSLFGQKDIVLKGKLYRPVDSMVLCKSIEDLRYQGVTIHVQSDSTFEYVMKDVKQIEKYKLWFWAEVKRGGRVPVEFYSDSDELIFEIYPPQLRDKTNVSGSLLYEYKSNFEETFKVKYFEKAGKIYGALRDPSLDSLSRVKAQARVDSINSVMFKDRDNFFKSTPNLVGYYEYYDALLTAEQRKLDKSKVTEDYHFWTRAFPNHPLTDYTRNAYSGKYDVVEEGSYVNIPLVSTNGISKPLSEIVSTHDYTLLDLWAPWCGPCIRKSKAINENYALVQEKGIEVVSVMGGIASMEKYNTSMEKYNYPWKVYIEIDNQNHIWQKYGCSQGGGKQVLIDKSGSVIAVNPSLEIIQNLPSN